MDSISPIDGRYKNKTQELSKYFSERSLFNYRASVEILYFESLLEKLFDDNTYKDELDNLKTELLILDDNDYNQIKEIEKIINHDVKSVEYFIKKKMEKYPKLLKYSELIHFGLTSEDINSPSYAMMIKDAINNVINPIISQIINKLKQICEDFKGGNLVGYTHGQCASPTTLSKELYVFLYRLEKIFNREVVYSAKAGGSIGNMTVHKICYPEISWLEFFDYFFEEKLDLKRNSFTTQIDNYDDLCNVFFKYQQINNVLIDMCSDIWMYISKNFIKLKTIKSEVGSSTLPQKVNPIQFENSEANLKLANNLFQFFINEIPKSRLQRDITGSSIYRNFGNGFSYSLIAYKSLLSGLDRIDINKEQIEFDFQNNIVILSEVVSGLLKKDGKNGYQILKDFTRGKELQKDEFIYFMKKNLKDKDFQYLKKLYKF
jgi:adenylosuccinate lyase